MTTNKRMRYNLYAAVLAVCLFAFYSVGGRQKPSAFAEERAYTNVLADLQKDETFSVINYPEIIDPENELYGVIQVIQIAESESGELFLYTYQPSNIQKLGDLQKSKIKNLKKEGYKRGIFYVKA